MDSKLDSVVEAQSYSGRINLSNSKLNLDSGKALLELLLGVPFWVELQFKEAREPAFSEEALKLKASRADHLAQEDLEGLLLRTLQLRDSEDSDKALLLEQDSVLLPDKLSLFSEVFKGKLKGLY